MEEHGEGGAGRRASGRVRKVAPKVGAALQDTTMRAQAAAARLEALEKDTIVYEAVEIEDDDEASIDEDERPTQKKTPKGSKRKTRQARALERVASTKKAPRGFLDLLQEANLESLPPMHRLTCVQQLGLPVWVHADTSAVFVATLPPTPVLDVVRAFAALDVKHYILIPVVKSF